MFRSFTHVGTAVGRTLRSLGLVGVAGVGVACGGDAGTTAPGGGGGGGTPGFTIASSAASLTVARGASGTATITVTRTGSFTGPVSLQPTGQPAGVTAVFSAASVVAGQATSTLTITASATAAAGTTPITIVANGAGVANKSLTIQLTVTVPVQTGPFTMSLSVSSFLALPATVLTSPPILTIARNAGFTGAVALTVSGLPVGLLVAPSPTSVSASTASMLVLNAGAANGTYPVTIRGVAAGLGEQSLTFNVVVASPSTGSITWQFCDNAARAPQWFFAVKDGAGAWTRIVPNGTSYSFNVTSPTAQVALVTPDSGGFRTTVYQYTAQEIAARAASECANYPGTSTRNATGQVTGLPSNDLSVTSMGTWQQSTLGPGSYNMLNLPAGSLDLVSIRGTSNAQGDLVVSRGVVRRGLNPASGSANAPIDFGAAEAFAPTTPTWTFGGSNGQPFSVSQYFSTAGGTAGQLMVVPGLDHTTTVRTLYGVPAAQTIAGDLHQVIATVQTTGQIIRATRQIVSYARTLADRTVNFGPAMPAATVTAIPTAPAGRLRAQGTVPNEYASGVSFDMTQTTIGRFGTINATRGFLGAGTAYDLQMPDLSAAVGWDTNFAMRPGVATNYWVSGGGPVLDVFDPRIVFGATRVRWTGALTGVTPPADGATYLIGRAAGNITP